LKLNRSHSRNQAQFQARLEAQRQARRSNIEEVTDLSTVAAGNSLFKSSVDNFSNIDELVVAGNQSFENLDNVDFATFRNNKKLGRKTLKEVEKQVGRLHADRTSPEFKRDLSRVLNARYLQGHGIQVEAHLDAKEMRDLRKYFQKETSTYNVADAARSMNASLEAGLEDVGEIKLEAEKYLFTERGLPAEQFDERFANLKIQDLAKIRDFSDAWSTSQGGKFLRLTQGESFNQHRESMSREMLASYGYQHVNSVDLDTALSLLRDIDSEGPRTNDTIRESVNQSLAEGEKDYFVLNTRANQAVLRDIGVTQSELDGLEVSDKALAKAYPDDEPRESRAVRTKVLRDLLRALPLDERAVAREQLTETGANLINSEATLSAHFGERIQELTGNSVKINKMGAMQRANFTSALSKMPKALRLEVFTGPSKEIANQLEKAIESQFGIEVHRQAGTAPDGNKSVAPFVKDWTVQGLVDLYNAMNGMAKRGKLPETLIGNSTIAYVEGASESPSMSVGPQPIVTDPVGPWDRPGAFAHDSGKSGYYGMCAPDSTGHDTVYFCDDALKGTNADSADTITVGESTIIHEFGHAIQLGGTPGADTETRTKEQQVAMAEWSALSRWSEPDEVLADGVMGTFEYYYDPTVQVGKRREVATSYGASDPCEDFAEYAPYFFKAPDVAMELSAEKFLYLNEMVGGFYNKEQVRQVGHQLGLSRSDLQRAEETMRQKIAAAPGEAQIKLRSA
jgi:hypothetical protein